MFPIGHGRYLSNLICKPSGAGAESWTPPAADRAQMNTPPHILPLCYSSRPLNSAATSLQASAPRESGTDRTSVQTFTHFRDQRLATVGQRRSFFDEARENSASSKGNISTVFLNVVCALIHNIAN